MTLRRKATLGLAAAIAAMCATAPSAFADTDPAGCTPTIEFDPDIPTWSEVNGDSLAGTNATGTASRHLTQDLYDYQQAIVAATADHPRVKVIEKTIGETVLGTFDVPGQQRELKYVVVGTPENIDNLDEGRDDAAFWSGVVSGRVPASDALQQVRNRPAFAWATATPHGNEPVAGEALMRQLYELVARLDCANARRLANLDVFIDPARNPDGRDNNSRLTAWGYDPNRDFGTRNQPENRQFMPEITKYPGLFFIDAHQQTSGYFFPPNQDPVHHEISNFALDMINNKVGPALQRKFNDQSSAYRNYNTYDLFAPVFGDTVPSLIMGGGGMTYEKGASEGYGKQIYDHYLAIDETINVASDKKVELLTNWIAQWQEAINQGQSCQLQENKIVSPVNLGTIAQPNESVCGYFYKPGEHSGDVATLVDEMVSTGVQVYRLNQAVTSEQAHVFGTPKGARQTETLPAGTLWIPLAQPMKHWIQAVLGEDPFIPFTYYYDVVSWSYNLNRVGAGAGMLTQQMPSNVAMSQIDAANFGSAPNSEQPVYAFNTDSMQSLAMVTELLEKDVTVYRGKTAFDHAGQRFHTGAALVDGASLAAAGVNIAQLAADRDTPVFGLPNYPVARFAMAKPKIGIYTGVATEPSNPLRPGAGTGHCAGNAYCSALFVLTQKDRVPASMVHPVTPTDLNEGDLVNEGYTAFVNHSAIITGGLSQTAIQTFVNGGGRYVGTLAGGTTTARNAGMTTLNTNAMTTTGCGSTTVITSTTCFGTPGSTFIGEFALTDPVAWGHDRGGFVYRDASSNPAYDPNTMAGNPSATPAIPAATASISYGAQPKALGFERNAATGDARLANRPAVVRQPFGSGVAVLIGFDPFFRAWHEGSERIVLNSILYPTGTEIAAPPAARRAVEAAPTSPAALARALEPRSEPIAKADLAAVANRPVNADPDTSRDVWIEVGRSDRTALRKAVRKAKVPRAIRRRARFVVTRTKAVYYVRRGAESGGHRPHWAGRIVGALRTYRVKPTGGKLG
jgi:Zinc carboxypeptidase